MALTKAALAVRLVEAQGLDPQDAASLVNDVFETLRTALVQGQEVKLSGFGHFELRDLSTGQNLQGPRELDKFFGEIQDDVAKEVESMAEEGFERPLERFFLRMGLGPSWSSSPVR
jgi:nucleoid DNA-binding protein